MKRVHFLLLGLLIAMSLTGRSRLFDAEEFGSIDKEYVYAPWRDWYEGTGVNTAPIDACILCHLGYHDVPGNRVLACGEHVYIMLNKFPYTQGHIMVVPYAHVSSPAELSDEARYELFETVSACVTLLTEELGNCGINIGMNMGYHSGGSIPEHIHVHIVPRFGKHGSFMDFISNSPVITWDMDRLYERLLPCFHSFNAS